jgi:hypothetical protein
MIGAILILSLIAIATLAYALAMNHQPHSDQVLECDKVKAVRRFTQNGWQG